jgi:hypothetical protein
MEKNNGWGEPYNNSNVNNSGSMENVNTLPVRFKLDLDTPMETFFFWMMIIGGIAAIIGLINTLDGNASAQTLLTVGVVVAAIAGVLYKATDNYYIIDSEKKMMLYRFKFFTINNLKIFAPFSSIHAATVNGRKQHSKHSSWWEYRAEIVLASGKVYPISDWKKYAFETADKKARNMADITGAEFIENSEECMCSPARGLKGKYTFKSTPYSIMYNLKRIGLPLVIMLISFVFIMLMFNFF